MTKIGIERLADTYTSDVLNQKVEEAYGIQFMVMQKQITDIRETKMNTKNLHILHILTKIVFMDIQLAGGVRGVNTENLMKI